MNPTTDTMKIDIIGTGNVGTHLLRAFEGKADAKAVNPHSLEGLREDSEIYIISVSDDAIPPVAKRLKSKISKESILAHTSGTTPLSVLKGTTSHTGVFYPLQTFSKNVALDYSEIPFFIEGESDVTVRDLDKAARLISGHVSRADSEQRKDLHIASVLSCNFCNHLWSLADSYLEKHGLDFKTLLPLIRETARKAAEKRPGELQTGPAVRHDLKIMESHSRKLEENPELLDIYTLLSMSIMNHHPKTRNQNKK